MNANAEHRAIQGELFKLVEQGLLTEAERGRIAARYPSERWNVVALVRWFTLFGAVAIGLGIVLLAPQLIAVQNLIDFGVGLLFVGLLAAAHYLERRRGLAQTGAALQLLASFALQGWITALAVRFSTGSDDWPGLLTISALASAALAYALGNRLVLIHAILIAFVAFGGETGYVSGWGMYWLGMSYPVRFLLAGLVSLALAVAHARLLRGSRQGFARVYLHYGLLVLNLALWCLALFGPSDFDWHDNDLPRGLFSLLWAGCSVASLLVGARTGLRLARGYGLTFLIIDIYTCYFQFIAVSSGEAWVLHALVVGASLVGLGTWLERRLSAARKLASQQA